MLFVKIELTKLLTKITEYTTRNNEKHTTTDNYIQVIRERPHHLVHRVVFAITRISVRRITK